MPTEPTQTGAIALFLLFGAVFALMITGRFRYDLVAFGALMVAVATGLVPESAAFDGLGHPATLVVALVLVVSAGLVRSGAVHLITRNMIDPERGLGRHITLMGAVGGLLSAFMNNVAALALLMPVDIQTARRAGRAARLTLMPLSFATILGGMATLIGTPPNIIIAQIRKDATGEAFAMFDFAPVGGLTALVGLLFVAVIGWRLIPAAPEDGGDSMSEIAQYVAELRVPEGSRHVGARLSDLYEAADKADVAVLGLIRGGRRRYGTQADTRLQAGDLLVLEAAPDALDEFRAGTGLAFVEIAAGEKPATAPEGMILIEVVVADNSRLVGKSAMSVGLTWRRQAVLLGISRQGRRIRRQVRKTPLRLGDILLLMVPRDSAADLVGWIGCLALADRGLAVTNDDKVWLAIGIFAAAVLAAAIGLVDLPIALGIVVVLYVLTGILPLGEIYGHIEWPVVVLLGSMIPLGAALESSGGTAMIADGLIALTVTLPAWAILTLLMAVTMSLSDVLNNTATAIVAAPVGITMAERLDVSADPFLMAVAVAASCAFLTPIGHKNNMLILGPGGYRFGDYWRMGLPLEILVVAVSVPLILIFWPL